MHISDAEHLHIRLHVLLFAPLPCSDQLHSMIRITQKLEMMSAI